MSATITSRHHPLCKLVRSLHTSKGRKQSKLFLLEGGNAVSSALRVRWPLQQLIVPEGELGEEWQRLGESSDVPSLIVDAELLKYLSDTESAPDVIALAKIPRHQSTLWPSDDLLLVVDGVGDPGNVGTLIRAADAVGASGVALSQNSADALAPKVVRSSAGSLFHLPPLPLENNSPEAMVAELQSRHIPIITAEAHNGIDCYQYDWPNHCALVLGHETRGVSPIFSQAATARVTIPMYGRAESLNVAMAGTLLLYAWRQHRGI
jgi:TrmH family RNA methyltransferase